MKIITLIIVIVAIITGIFFIMDNKDSKNPEDEIIEEQIVEEEVKDIEAIKESEDSADAKKDLIVVDEPKIGDKISSPLNISGKARGTWFFEASFPVFVTDWDGKIIGQGIAQADGEWMTEEFVPFTAEITYDKEEISGQYSDRGTLILKKDNPSGLPEHDDALEMLIYFK